jgi:hypothetical protein
MSVFGQDTLPVDYDENQQLLLFGTEKMLLV